MNDQPRAVEEIAPGIRVCIYDETASVPLRIRTVQAMADWIPFVADVTRDESTQVATTLEYRGAEYAIRACTGSAAGWQYDLVPWPPGDLVRRRIPLTREHFQLLEAQRQEAQRERRRDRVIHVLAFLIAFLPAARQERIGERFDYDAEGWTKINSAVFGLLSLSVMLVFHVIAPLAAGYQSGTIGSPGGLVGLYVVWSPYFAVDSLIRFAHAMTAEKPLGLLPLELVDRIVRKYGRG